MSKWVRHVTDRVQAGWDAGGTQGAAAALQQPARNMLLQPSSPAAAVSPGAFHRPLPDTWPAHLQQLVALGAHQQPAVVLPCRGKRLAGEWVVGAAVMQLGSSRVYSKSRSTQIGDQASARPQNSGPRQWCASAREWAPALAQGGGRAPTLSTCPPSEPASLAVTSCSCSRAGMLLR